MVFQKQIPTYLKLSIPFSLLLIITLVAQFSINQNVLNISNAISVDLLFIIPVVYFLMIRKTTIPKLTVVPFFVLCTIISVNLQATKDLFITNFMFNYIIPVIEVTVVSFIIYNFYKIAKLFRSNRKQIPDFYDNIKHAISNKIPERISVLLATELSVLYYGFVSWRKSKLSTNQFTYHKDGSSTGLFIGLLLIIIVEMSVVHVLVNKWNSLLASILGILSLYSIIQIVGFLKSIFKRPIVIKENQLVLRYGIMSEAIIDLENIIEIEHNTSELNKDSNTIHLSPLKSLIPHNVILQTEDKIIVNSLYGIKKETKSIAFYVDNWELFVENIQETKKALLYSKVSQGLSN